MIHFKKHIQKTKPYVGGSTRAEVADGGSVFKLSSNENPLGPSPKALAAIRSSLDSLSEYQFQDDQAFIEKLSDEFRNELEPEQFLPANSGMELLDIICRGLLEPGTNCILSSPTFMAYKNFAELAGARVVDVPLLDDSYQLDPEGILAAIDENTRLIFIANPNNPTGVLFPAHYIRHIVDRVPDHVVIVYDEVYHHFVDRDDYVRASDLIQENKNVIGIHSFSKAYGLAGIRLGYLFSTPAIAKYLRQYRRPFMISSTSVAAGMAALDDNFHLERTVSLVSTEKKWVSNELRKHGIKFWSSDANFILIRPTIPAARFCQFMLQKGIMVRSAEPLGAPGLVRISIGTRAMNEVLIDSIFSLQFCKIL